METKHRKKSGVTLGILGLATAMLALGACALKESTSGNDNPSIVVAVKDSSRIVLTFDNDTATIFTDSGSFNLVELRRKMADKGIDSDSIQITGIEVAYDEATRKFLADNEGVGFFLKIYTRDNDTGATKLALETLETDKNGFKALAFDPTMALLVINQHIFGADPGFPGVLSAIKDKDKTSIKVIAKMFLSPGEKLKTKGTLNLNLVVTVAGKV
jgi:hypothetical protein